MGETYTNGSKKVRVIWVQAHTTYRTEGTCIFQSVTYKELEGNQETVTTMKHFQELFPIKVVD